MIQQEIEFYGDTYYTSKPIILLISGKAGVGKTTLATILRNKLSMHQLDVLLTHFAEGVKRVAFQMGWNGKKDTAGRNLLQKIGAVGREYNEDTWVNFVLNVCTPEYTDINMTHPDIIVIDDWRYPNEYSALQKSGNFTIFTVNIKAKNREILRGTEYALDSSETSLDHYTHDDFYFVVDNTGSIEVLENSAQKIIDFIFDGRS
jgi:hypothetical protein